jgi:hypothetical protein
MYYQISYDLMTNKNYDRLQEGIKRYELNYPILLSTWIIKSDETATEIFDKLRAFIESDDVLFVSEVNANHRSVLSPKATEWMIRQKF